MLIIPLKTSTVIHLAAPLSSYIISRYKLDSGPFMRELLRLEEMRNAATSGIDSKRIASVDLILGYLQQLRALPRRFLIDSSGNGIKIQFAWHNSVPSSVEKEKPIASQELVYEELCSLFNAAIIYWQNGNDDFRADTPESLKRALTHFQKAFGIFSYIAERLIGESEKSTIPAASDLHSARCLSTLMHALGLECFYRNASVHEKDPPIKNSTLGRIALAVSERYEECLRHCNQSLHLFAPSWKVHLEAKSNYWKSKAEEQKSLDLLNREQHGEALARLGYARQLLIKLSNDKKLHELFRVEIGDLRQKVEESEQKAVRENNLIYHCLLKDYKELPSLQAAGNLLKMEPFDYGEGKSELLLFKGLPTLEAFRANEAAERAKATRLGEFTSKLNSIREALQRALDQYAPIINSILLDTNLSSGPHSLDQCIDGVTLSMSSVTLMRAESERMMREIENLLKIASALNDERSQYEQLKRTLDSAHEADKGIKQRFDELLEQAARCSSTVQENGWDLGRVADIKSRIASLKSAYATLNEESLRKFSENLFERLQLQTLEQEQLISTLRGMAQDIQRTGSATSRMKRDQGRLTSLLSQMESDLGEGMTFYSGFQEAAGKLLSSIKDYEASKALEALDLKDDLPAPPPSTSKKSTSSPKPGQWNPSIPIKFNK